MTETPRRNRGWIVPDDQTRTTGSRDGREAELARLRAIAAEHQGELAAIRDTLAQLETLVQAILAADSVPAPNRARPRVSAKSLESGNAAEPGGRAPEAARAPNRRQLLKHLGAGAAGAAAATALGLSQGRSARADFQGTSVGASTANFGVYASPNGVARPATGAFDQFGVIGVGDAGAPAPSTLPSGAGVAGLGNSFVGVEGRSTSSVGVLGFSLSNDAVAGLSSSSSDAGVFGSSPFIGVEGTSPSGRGVQGTTGAGAGSLVLGFRVAGVQGFATKNVGVYGYDQGAADNLASFGVFGHSLPAYGVFGFSAAPLGTLVHSPTGVPPGLIAVAGVMGTSSGNPGVYGISGTSIGVAGQSQNIGVLGGLIAGAGPSALAGLFLGNVQIQGSLTVTGSYPKSAAVPHPDGTHRRMYCVEAPEPYFEDFGEGRVENGRTSVTLDPDFLALVQGDRYHVFVTPHDDAHLHVRNRGARGFEVHLTTGAGGGPPPGAERVAAPERTGVPFSWRVVAKRKDLAGPRLERVDVRAAPIPRPQGVPAPHPPGPMPDTPDLDRGGRKR